MKVQQLFDRGPSSTQQQPETGREGGVSGAKSKRLGVHAPGNFGWNYHLSQALPDPWRHCLKGSCLECRPRPSSPPPLPGVTSLQSKQTPPAPSVRVGKPLCRFLRLPSCTCGIPGCSCPLSGCSTPLMKQAGTGRCRQRQCPRGLLVDHTAVAAAGICWDSNCFCGLLWLSTPRVV